MSTNHYLKVVNASAGSGKTFSLVKTYIRLLLLDEGENALLKYTEILAMTFTNKAAIEMKTRIIKALDELAFPDFHQSDYIQTIVNETGLKPDVIQAKAQHYLSSILHRYEDFSVMTIDKFNLRLIRSFSRDLDLPPDFEVVLNEQQVIEEVVDDIIGEIGKNDGLTKLLLYYSEANFEDDKGWNLKQSLVNFGTILTKEKELPYVERLMNMEFSIEDYNQHRQELNSIRKTYKTLCNDVFQFHCDNQLHTLEINHKNWYDSSINKCKDAELTDFKNDEKFIFNEKTLVYLEEIATTNSTVAEFLDLINKSRAFFIENGGYSVLLKTYLANYFNMALLKHFNLALTTKNRQERLVRISEFNTKIANLLQEDTLYIYEKLGTRFRHFMLDEFQDTSRLQWLNLIPLVRESLGGGNQNFIVGDSKQAIYRFKNGVAEQFVELPRIYNPENDPRIEEISSYFDTMGEKETLEDNWRSAPEIVQFNNDLFLKLRENLDAYQARFYDSIAQNPKSSKNGYVYVECVNKKSKDEEEDGEKYSIHLPFILNAIQEALDDGFNPGDICILGSRNQFCTYIATQLSERNFSVVSADSLNIDSELTVKFVLSYFKLRLNPVNQNTIKQFFHRFCELFNYPLSHYESFFELVGENEQKQFKIASLNLFFLKHPDFEAGFFAPYESLYDLIQKTNQMFGLAELKNPYLHHLADLVFGYESKNGPDLNQFLSDYDTLAKDAKALQIAESDEAIKIMTIHKSKGLEFPVVITVSEFDEKLKINKAFAETNNYLIYAQPSVSSPIEELNELYAEESDSVLMDDLNLTYVAYTRPTTRLYVKSIFNKNRLSTYLQTALSSFETTQTTDEKLIFTAGERHQKVATKKHATDDHFFVPVSSSDNLWFPDIALQDNDELVASDFLSDEQRYGNQFHAAISSINGKEEIELVVHQMIQEGNAEAQFKQQLLTDLKKLFSSETYNQLFSHAQEILSEQSFIIAANEQIRPDKIIVKKDKTIVVDYKTGAAQKKYTKQVQQYCSVLQEMGYPNVEGHLFYTKNLLLERVI